MYKLDRRPIGSAVGQAEIHWVPMRMMLVCSFVPPFTAVVAAMTATMKFRPAFCVTSEKTAISRTRHCDRRLKEEDIPLNGMSLSAVSLKRIAAPTKIRDLNYV